MDRKGISPLIGTVLLVAIVIAMVLLIMPWVMETIRTQQEKTSEATEKFACITDLNFDLSLDGSNVIIDNRGDVNIESIKYRRYDSTGAIAATGGSGDKTIPVEAYAVVDSTVDCIADGRVEIIAVLADNLVCADNPRDIDCPAATV